MTKVILILLACFFTISVSGYSFECTNVADIDTLRYYDYSKTRTIKRLGNFKIKSTDIRTIEFDPIEGDLTDKNIFDRGDTLGFNIDMLYRCKFAGKENYYYFRMYWQTLKDGPVTVLYVHWEPGIPRVSNTEGVIEVVEVPYIQNGKTSVCTIGDSQTWLFHGEDYRKFWSELNGDLRFIGTRTDYYGFGHEGEGGNSSHDIIRRMNNFKVADIYVLLVGTNDRKVKIPVDSTVKNINTIVTHLRSLNNNARIYLLTTLPCVEAARDSENQQINVLLKSQFPVGANNITVLDTEKLFRDKEDWRTLMLDGLHPNGAGYRLLTGFLNENIK